MHDRPPRVISRRKRAFMVFVNTRSRRQNKSALFNRYSLLLFSQRHINAFGKFSVGS